VQWSISLLKLSGYADASIIMPKSSSTVLQRDTPSYEVGMTTMLLGALAQIVQAVTGYVVFMSLLSQM
jgi:hypothetical protein